LDVNAWKEFCAVAMAEIRTRFCSTFFDELSSHSAGGSQADDTTLLVMQVQAGPQNVVLALTTDRKQVNCQRLSFGVLLVFEVGPDTPDRGGIP
jgi:hypothetical protein